MFADRGKPDVIIPEAALNVEAAWKLHLAEQQILNTRIMRAYFMSPRVDGALLHGRYERAVKLLFVTAALEGKYDELTAEFTKRLLMR